jgi:hypothetical protein
MVCPTHSMKVWRRKVGHPITPMDGGLVAAALGDRGDASVLLERGGVWEAFAALAEGGEEARGQRRAGAWQGADKGVVGQLRGKLADLVVETLDGSAGGAELREQDLDERPVREAAAARGWRFPTPPRRTGLGSWPPESLERAARFARRFGNVRPSSWDWHCRTKSATRA